MNHYNCLSQSYNSYSFPQPPVVPYAQGTFTPPASQATMAGGMEHADFARDESIGVKFINPDKKNEAKLFMLRNVNFHCMNGAKDLYAVIIEQLGNETVTDSTDFEVGYYVGNKRVWIQNRSDIHDVHLLKTRDNHSVTLWCIGHSATPTVSPTGSKCPRNSTVLTSDDSDEETPEKQQTT